MSNLEPFAPLFIIHRMGMNGRKNIDMQTVPQGQHVCPLQDNAVVY